MSDRSAAITRLAILIVSASALSFGLLWRNESFIVAAAIIHILVGVAELFQDYRDAKRLRAGTWKPEEQRSLAVRTGNWLRGAITLTGLVLLLGVAGVGGSSSYGIAGGIIWGGALVCYFLSGIIAREVGGIPFSMGYGGWAVRHTRKGRYRM